MNKLPSASTIRNYLKEFNFFERYVHGQWEGDLYVATHARRFQETLSLLPKLISGARVLELGAVPYYLTILLRKFAGLEVDPLSFYEFEEAEQTTHTVENRDLRERYTFKYVAVNVERDVFPSPDDAYDLVLCCEILEHLLINPSHMLYEIHRVLRPGGHLLVSTPNVLRWGNVFSLFRGHNIYDSYHGNGMYGRHNREYSMGEVAQLLEANGFSIEWIGTRCVYGPEFLNKVPVILDNRRDSIFAVATAVDTPRMSVPTNLYTLMEEYRNVVRADFRMGFNEVGQIGRGWFALEPGDPAFRWTGKSAEFYLKNPGARKIVMELRCDHPDIENQPLEITLRVNAHRLPARALFDHSWNEIGWELDAVAGEQLLSCEVTVSRVWVPQEAGSSDARQLGVAVSRVWLE